MDTEDTSVGEQSTTCSRNPSSAREEAVYVEVVAGEEASKRKSLVDGHLATSNQPSASSTITAEVLLRLLQMIRWNPRLDAQELLPATGPLFKESRHLAPLLPPPKRKNMFPQRNAKN